MLTSDKKIAEWLEGPFDEASKQEIRRLEKENPEELKDAFYQDLDFGTGGLRGIMGVGTNRMNLYTVGKATQGLANYIRSLGGGKHSVLIGYDSRNNSKAFADEAAAVLLGNGIDVLLYKELRPVPLVSFGVRYKKCIAGIMITASHNPPQYNGYKVYWSDGGQVLPPHDRGIIAEAEKVTSPRDIKRGDSKQAKLIDGEIDTFYLTNVRNLQLHPGENHTHGGQLRVIYTSLHGCGITMVPRLLRDWGFTDVELVNVQCKPDGNFPTVKSPNPEEKAALKLGTEQMVASKADLLIATDPDTDRMGAVVRHKGHSVILNGNELACIMLEHICRALHESKQMPPKPTFIKTIVTTELFKEIVDHYKAICLDVLTGFKYIGQKMTQYEEEEKAGVTSHHYLFGAEESYGYLYGTHVRDKDAIICSALLCEAALHQKLQGKTLVDLLYDIYRRQGIFREKLVSITLEGHEGQEKIKTIMSNLRSNPPRVIGNIPVISIDDYLTHKTTILSSNTHEPLTLPKSDVLRFWLNDGTKLVIRPSGTEPKLKIYCGVKEKHHFTDDHSLEKALIKADHRALEMIAHLKAHLLA